MKFTANRKYIMNEREGSGAREGWGRRRVEEQIYIEN